MRGKHQPSCARRSLRPYHIPSYIIPAYVNAVHVADDRHGKQPDAGIAGTRRPGRTGDAIVFSAGGNRTAHEILPTLPARVAVFSLRETDLRRTHAHLLVRAHCALRAASYRTPALACGTAARLLHCAHYYRRALSAALLPTCDTYRPPRTCGAPLPRRRRWKEGCCYCALPLCRMHHTVAHFFASALCRLTPFRRCIRRGSATATCMRARSRWPRHACIYRIIRVLLRALQPWLRAPPRR